MMQQDYKKIPALPTVSKMPQDVTVALVHGSIKC